MATAQELQVRSGWVGQDAYYEREGVGGQRENRVLWPESVAVKDGRLLLGSSEDDIFQPESAAKTKAAYWLESTAKVPDSGLYEGLGLQCLRKTGAGSQGKGRPVAQISSCKGPMVSQYN